MRCHATPSVIPDRRQIHCRDDVNATVTHAHVICNTAVRRSLGRAGYGVHAFTDVPDAVVLRSRYVAVPVVTPGYESPHFADWVLDYVHRHDIRVVIPSEGFLVATRGVFDRLRPLMPLPTYWDTVEESFSKTRCLDTFLRSEDAGRSGGVFRCTTPAEARAAVERLLGTHGGELEQGPAPGVKATFDLCLHRGRLLAESMAVALHQAPDSGGLMVLRRTW